MLFIIILASDRRLFMGGQYGIEEANGVAVTPTALSHTREFLWSHECLDFISIPLYVYILFYGVACVEYFSSFMMDEWVPCWRRRLRGGNGSPSMAMGSLNRSIHIGQSNSANLFFFCSFSL